MSFDVDQRLDIFRTNLDQDFSDILLNRDDTRAVSKFLDTILLEKQKLDEYMDDSPDTITEEIQEKCFELAEKIRYLANEPNLNNCNLVQARYLWSCFRNCDPDYVISEQTKWKYFDPE